VIALGHVARLRLALDDAPRAEQAVSAALMLARAEPSVRPRAWALVEYVGARCERAVPAEPGGGVTPATIVRRERLRECLHGYREAAFLADDAPVDVRARVRIATARVQRALGDDTAARSLTREAIALYRAARPDDPAVDVGLDGRDPYAAMLDAQRQEAARLRRSCPGCGGGTHGASGITSPFYEMREEPTPCDRPLDEATPSSATARACDAAAEGRMALALDHLRHLDSSAPRPPPRGSRRAYDAWVAATLTPWVEERVFRLRWLAGPLTAVVNTGRAARSPAALATLAQAFLDFSAVIAPSPPPPEIAANPLLLEAWNMSRCGSDPPHLVFVQTALEGFRRCALTAAAERETAWLRHCERRLYEIDRVRFPLPDEVTPAPRASKLSAR
jgi:hypothetical protein